jgi:oxazoline/thiazoline synthase
MAENSRDCALRLAPHLRLVVVGPETAFAIGEGHRYALRGRSALMIASLLDGQRGGSDIVAAAIAAGAPAAEDALGALVRAGIAQSVPLGAPELTTAAFDAAARLVIEDPLPAVVVQSCMTKSAGVAAERTREALAAAGLSVCDEGEIQILVCDDYLEPELLRVHETWLQRAADGRPRALVLLKPTGRRALIGPLFGSSKGPCLVCLRHALGRQRPLEAALEALGCGASLPCGALAASTDAAANLLAVALRRWLGDAGGRADHPLAAGVTVLDSVDLRLSHHRVLRRPQCPGCGDGALVTERGFTPPGLAERAPAVLRDGGLRRDHPAEAYERLAHLVSDLLGPVTYVTAEPAEYDALPVFLSGFMASTADRSLVEQAGNPFDQVCAGKGFTAAQARMSALGEALERQAGLFQGDEACIYASHDRLDRADGPAVARLLGRARPAFERAAEHGTLHLLHPDALQLFSAGQLAQRDGRPVGGARVPLAYPADVEIAWTPIWPLGTEGVALAPLAYVYARVPETLGSRYCVATSNGSASGATLAEAALQGLFELVERDAVAIWWYNRLRRAEIELGALGLAEAQREVLGAFRATCARQGLDTWTLDLTHDLGIPVAAAVAYERRRSRFAFGFGCHLSGAASVTRAFSELAQLLRGSRKGPSPWDAIADVDHRFLFPCSETPRSACYAADPASSSTDEWDAAVELRACTSRLAARRLSVFVVDKSRPDVELRVAQVVVPGLRHAWPRFAPGRLYDVPVELGLRKHPLGEEGLNPIPLLI